MPKLHQILAIERDVAQTTNRRITDAYQTLQKPALLSGLTRTYQPNDEEGEILPPEQTLVQVNAQTVIEKTVPEFERIFNLEAIKDFGNLTATADVVLPDGTILIEGAPATYLLWLEKQMNDVITIIQKLPTLDPSQTWTYDDSRGCFVTAPTVTNRGKKVPRVLVKAPATDKHPAQVDVWQEDVIVGTWTKIEFSGALPAQTVREMLDRALAVREAVKVARSKANETEVQDRQIAAPLLNHIFGTNIGR